MDIEQRVIKGIENIAVEEVEHLIVAYLRYRPLKEQMEFIAQLRDRQVFTMNTTCIGVIQDNNNRTFVYILKENVVPEDAGVALLQGKVLRFIELEDGRSQIKDNILDKLFVTWVTKAIDGNS